MQSAADSFMVYKPLRKMSTFDGDCEAKLVIPDHNDSLPFFSKPNLGLNPKPEARSPQP